MKRNDLGDEEAVGNTESERVVEEEDRGPGTQGQKGEIHGRSSKCSN